MIPAGLGAESKYPPGQGLLLAIGQRVAGNPLVGVWLSSALACAALCWMLQAWVEETMALYGALLARAGELARTVADNAPLTLRVTKEALRRLQAKMGDENIDDLIRHTYGSADFKEGMDAFLGKRAPKWTGS